MNIINMILKHRVFLQTGVWYDSPQPWALMSDAYGLRVIEWDVPGWPLAEIAPAQTHISPDGETVVDAPAVMGQVPPDIAAFTEQDSADAELAWAQHVQAIKSPARKNAENRFILVCDSIKGTTHQPFGPEEARTLYDAAVAAGNFQLATQSLGQWLLAAVGLLAADIGDVSWHSES